METERYIPWFIPQILAKAGAAQAQTGSLELSTSSMWVAGTPLLNLSLAASQGAH